MYECLSKHNFCMKVTWKTIDLYSSTENSMGHGNQQVWILENYVKILKGICIILEHIIDIFLEGIQQIIINLYSRNT